MTEGKIYRSDNDMERCAGDCGADPIDEYELIDGLTYCLECAPVVREDETRPLQRYRGKAEIEGFQMIIDGFADSAKQSAQSYVKQQNEELDAMEAAE